jgi:hypothetical protein
MQVHDPVEALRLIGRGYLTFAWRYPELYRVMYGLDGATFTPETYEGGQQIDDVVSEAVRQALEFRGWPVNHLAEKVNILWSTAHGLVTLTMADRIAGGQAQALHLLDWAIQESLLAWEHEANAPFSETSSEQHTSL